jgi:predicted transcriptional regulator
MKLRKVTIGIRRVDEWAETVKRGLRTAASGGRVKPGESLTFENAAALRHFFSDRRLELLHAIREYRPRSIKELAERVGRDFKNVNADVHYLARLGLVELAREDGSGAKGRKAPRVLCDEIEVRIPI